MCYTARGMRKTFRTARVAQTKKFASVLARAALSLFAHAPMPHALVMGLEGTLGSGKTTFAQGFARGLGIKEKISSPTFVLLKKYRVPPARRARRHATPLAFYHIDCYRLARAQDLAALGFQDIVSDPRAIVLVEWSDRVRRLLPKHRITIHFAHAGKNRRRISITKQ